MVPSVTAYASLIERKRPCTHARSEREVRRESLVTGSKAHFRSVMANQTRTPSKPSHDVLRVLVLRARDLWDLWDFWDFCNTMDVDLILLGPFPEYGSSRKEKEAWYRKFGELRLGPDPYPEISAGKLGYMSAMREPIGEQKALFLCRDRRRT